VRPAPGLLSLYLGQKQKNATPHIVKISAAIMRYGFK
jgi:hypothetical protein